MFKINIIYLALEIKCLKYNTNTNTMIIINKLTRSTNSYGLFPSFNYLALKYVFYKEVLSITKTNLSAENTASV